MFFYTKRHGGKSISFEFFVFFFFLKSEGNIAYFQDVVKIPELWVRGKNTFWFKYISSNLISFNFFPRQQKSKFIYGWIGFRSDKMHATASASKLIMNSFWPSKHYKCDCFRSFPKNRYDACFFKCNIKVVQLGSEPILKYYSYQFI